MATKRRPNVPRTVRQQRITYVSGVTSEPQAAEHRVIRADFAGHEPGGPSAVKPAPAKAVPAKPAAAKQTSVKPATAKPTAAKPASARATQARPTAKPASARPTAKQAPAKPAAKPTVAKSASARPSAEPASARKADVRPKSAEFRIRERVRLAGSIRRGTTKPPPEPVVSAESEPVPARTFSGRLLALAVVLIAITVMLAPSVRIYFQQQAEIAVLQADIAAKKDKGKEVQGQLDRWQDPAYVKAQARERLFLVMPGETRYLVKGVEGFTKAEGEAVGDAPEDLAWVDALWDSVQRSATAQ